MTRYADLDLGATGFDVLSCTNEQILTSKTSENQTLSPSNFRPLSTPPWELIALGARVFPVEAQGKKPVRGFKWTQKASADPARIKEWEAENPGCNWGVCGGALEGPNAGKWEILVLDCDTMPSYEWAIARYPELAQTASVKTGRGVHLYTAALAENVIGSCNGIVLPDDAPPGLKFDVKGAGGYVVAPGSIHETTGSVYHWREGSLDERRPRIMRAPAEWFDGRKAKYLLTGAPALAPAAAPAATPALAIAPAPMPAPMPAATPAPSTWAAVVRDRKEEEKRRRWILYCEKAIEGIQEQIARCTHGNGHDLYRDKALRLYSLRQPWQDYDPIEILEEAVEHWNFQTRTKAEVLADIRNCCASAEKLAARVDPLEVLGKEDPAFVAWYRQPPAEKWAPPPAALRAPAPAAVEPGAVAVAASADDKKQEGPAPRVLESIPVEAFDRGDRRAIAYHLAAHWLTHANDVYAVQVADDDLHWYVRDARDARWRRGAVEVRRIVGDVCRYRLLQRGAKGATSPLLVPANAKIEDILLELAGDCGRLLSPMPRSYAFLRDPWPGAWFLLPDGRLWNLETQSTRPAPATYWAQRCELACVPAPGPTIEYDAAMARVGITGERLRRLDQIIGLCVFGKGRNLGRAPLLIGEAGTGKSVIKTLIYEMTGGAQGCCNPDMSPEQIDGNSFHRSANYQYRIAICDDKQEQLRKAESSFLDMACGEAGARTCEAKFGAITQIETEQIWLTIANKIPPIAEAGGRASRRWLALQFEGLQGARDARLLDKLRAEMPQILWRAAWAILPIHGPQDFDRIADDADMLELIEEEGSLYARWIAQRLEVDAQSTAHEMSIAWLICDFQGWCAKSHLRAGDKVRAAALEIGRLLRNRGCTQRRNKNARLWSGVRLRPGKGAWDECGDLMSLHTLTSRFPEAEGPA